MKSVENGLLKAVVFKGMELEKARLNERMQFYNIPGVSIAVIYKNQIDWANAYGFKEFGLTETVTTESLFQAGALSQSVAALVALHFVEKGQLALDSDVNTVLLDWEGGFGVLQQLLVDLEKKAFPAIAEEAVLQPIGMKNSTFVSFLPPSLKEKAVPGHLPGGDPVEGKWLRYPVAAASGLWSTPTDMALFAVEVMKAARGESQKIVSAALGQAMLTPEEGIHGLGFYIEDEGDDLFFHMKGDNTGYACFMVGYPVRGEGAVIMTNSDNGAHLIDEIVRGISAVYEWPHFQPEVKTLYRLDSSVYPQYVGRYEINPDYVLNVTHEDYYMIITPTGQAPTKFYAQGLTVFFSEDP
ncbi:MAG: beta-lactamase family protein, partial [Candidatus Aminicenantes bacterium]|nr:beta-lactamase family protein [Candidatus Aminicenantes bacterium]